MSSAWLPSPAPVTAASSGVDQPAVGRVQPGLRDRAHGLRAGGEVSEPDRGRGAAVRPRTHPDPRLGDEAERALGPEQHPVRRDAGAGAGQPPGLPDADRRERADRFHEVVDVRQQRREVPTGARRDPAAERRELKRLGEVAQRQAVLAQLRLEDRPGGASLDPRGAGDLVDFEHPVERLEVDRDDALEAPVDDRLDAADDARPAAERDHGGAGAERPLEHRLDVGLVTRAGDDVRRVGEVAAERADDVAIRAPVAVQRPLVVVGVADPGEGGGDLEPRRRQTRQRRRRLRLGRAEAEPFGDDPRGGPLLLERRLLVFVAPSPVLQSPRHGARA